MILRSLFEALVVLLNRTPLRSVFAAWYEAGVRSAVSRMSRHPAVRAIYGTGSYFEGRAVYGISDIDLVIAISPEYSRHHIDLADVASAYRRARFWYPCLGSWSEKEGTLVPLREVREGRPLPSSLRELLAYNRLVTLFGPPAREILPEEPPSVLDRLNQATTLLRLAVLHFRRYGRRPRFWRALFFKLHRLADDAGATRSARRIREGVALLKLGELALCFASLNASDRFEELEDEIHYFLNEIAGPERRRRTWRVTSGVDELQYGLRPSVLSVIERLRRSEDMRLNLLPPGLISLLPAQFFFPPDAPIPALDAPRGFSSLVRAVDVLQAHGRTDDALVVMGSRLGYLLSRQPTFVEVTPLDPFAFAPFHALLSGKDHLEVPPALDDILASEAGRLLKSIAPDYDRALLPLRDLEGATMFREDDGRSVAFALQILRFVEASRIGVVATRGEDILEAMARHWPETAELAAAMGRVYAESRGKSFDGPAPNNVERAMNTFLKRLLRGEDLSPLEPVSRRLSLTVGIVTRDRATTLRDALESLTRQTRVPDQVVVVDNGSTDGTPHLLKEFSRRLPLQVSRLERPSIPASRNEVIAAATGEIVAFTDDDCACEPRWLESIERAFLRGDNVGIVGGYVEHWTDGSGSVVDRHYSLFHQTPRPEPQ